MDYQANDTRLGKLAADGSTERWPTADAFGGRFREEDRPNFTRRRLAGTPYFVVYTPGAEVDGVTFTLAAVDPSVFTELPEQTKRGKG